MRIYENRRFLRHNRGRLFFTGVPDSLLKPLADYLLDNYDDVSKHIIAANEGNAIAIGAGYYLSTGWQSASSIHAK